jgi:hypothetical protein
MLLILPLLILLIWSVLAVGRQQQAAIELRHQSRAMTFAQAHGLDLSVVPQPEGLPATVQQLRVGLQEPAGMAALPHLGTLHAELGLQPLGLVGTRLGVTVSSPRYAPLTLRRELLTVGMPLLPASTQEVRRVIEQAPLTWQKEGGASTQMTLQRGQTLSRLDAAWGRAPVQPSWLSAWEGFWGERP